MGQGLQETTWHFLAYSAGIAAALLIIAGLIVLARAIGIKIPLDVVTLVEDVLKRRTHKNQRLVNVLFLDRDGKVVALVDLVTIKMHNGTGPVYELIASTFLGCDGEVVRASAHVRIDYQNGALQEDLIVQLDNERGALVLKSHYSVREILDCINGETPKAA